MASFYTQVLGQGFFDGGGGILGGPWPGARVVLRDLMLWNYNGDGTYAGIFGSSDESYEAVLSIAGDNAFNHWVGSQALIDGDVLNVDTDSTGIYLRASGWVLLPFS